MVTKDVGRSLQLDPVHVSRLSIEDDLIDVANCRSVAKLLLITCSGLSHLLHQWTIALVEPE
jgi:hypothetical protein